MPTLSHPEPAPKGQVVDRTVWETERHGHKSNHERPGGHGLSGRVGNRHHREYQCGSDREDAGVQHRLAACRPLNEVTPRSDGRDHSQARSVHPLGWLRIFTRIARRPIPPGYGARVPAKICHASIDFATRLKMM